MSIYGNQLFANSAVNERDSEYLFENTYVGDIISEAKIPQDIKMSTEDFLSSSRFKQKSRKYLDYAKENDIKSKIVAKTVYTWYYGLIGSYFGSQSNKKYQPILGYYIDLVNKYCNDKQKNRIKTDMEKTIDAVDKYKERNEKSKEPKDISLNLAWQKDVKSVVNKIK